jgi:hypothetical protein
MSHSPPDDAVMIVIIITLPEGTDARVKITSGQDCPQPVTPEPDAG